MLKQFRRAVTQELSAHPSRATGQFAAGYIGHLPEPVQRYFRTCGWMGRARMSNVAISIASMKLKMNLEKDFVSVRSLQFNSVAEPMRIAYMKSSLFGIIPFCGIDRFQNGEGHMDIELMHLFPVVRLKGPEMNKAALVTVLAETFLAPSYALQPYIEWRPLDRNSAEASISFKGTTASGKFHFNDEGELERFETNDRYLTQKDGSMKQTAWVAEMGGYRERNGVRIATELSAAWVTERGSQPYASMKIDDVRYDIRSADEVLFKKI